MKSFSILFLILALVINTSLAYAAPVGNIATPALLKSAIISKHEEKPAVGFVAGAEVDISNPDIEGQVGNTDLYFYNAKVGVVFSDRFILYGLGGSANLEEQFRDKGARVKIESNTDFSWGVGGTLLLYETTLYDLDNSTLRIGVDGRFRWTDLEVDKVFINGRVFEIPDFSASDLQIDYEDWQIAGAVSWQWKRFIPYVGVKYSDKSGELEATVSGVKYRTDIEGADKVGVFFGTDILINDPLTTTDSVSINIEGRLIDEESLTLGLLIRF